jgi:hypothetical protein
MYSWAAMQSADDVPKPGARPKKPSGTNRSSGGGGRDFVQENIVDAGTRRKAATKAAEDPSAFTKKADYGRVPTYLHERKMELAATYARQQVRPCNFAKLCSLLPCTVSSWADLQAQKEAALIPEGMRIMGDDERSETLAVLENNKAEVEAALAKLPFVVKIPSQVRLKNQLERRLHEIEEATKIFSRPKVLVKS